MSRKIVSLEVENVKRISALQVQPDGKPLVVIGGKNGAGKSSVLDSIVYALGGKTKMPAKPVRSGEDEAEIVVELDGSPPLIVTRRIKADGKTTVEVKQKFEDGVESRVSSPQALLDSLVGRISFDPLEFVRLKPKDQVEMLKDVVGVSTDDLEAEEKQVFDERADINRELKRVQGQLDGFPDHGDVEEVDVQALVAKLGKIAEHNDGVNALLRQAESLDNVVKMREADRDKARDDVERLKQALAVAQAHRDSCEEVLAHDKENAIDAKGRAEAKAFIDDSDVKRQISEAHSVNQKFRDNQQRAAAQKTVDSLKAKSDALTAKIEQVRADKLKRMQSAKWPVAGLGFGDDGVTMEGLPFEQCSSAEQLRISTAVGLSANPKLNVLMIRDGSLLDEDSLKQVSDIAESAGAQVWIERVGEGAECSVVIEDGAVKATKEA